MYKQTKPTRTVFLPAASVLSAYRACAEISAGMIVMLHTVHKRVITRRDAVGENDSGSSMYTASFPELGMELSINLLKGDLLSYWLGNFKIDRKGSEHPDVLSICCPVFEHIVPSTDMPKTHKLMLCLYDTFRERYDAAYASNTSASPEACHLFETLLNGVSVSFNNLPVFSVIRQIQQGDILPVFAEGCVHMAEAAKANNKFSKSNFEEIEQPFMPITVAMQLTMRDKIHYPGK